MKKVFLILSILLISITSIFSSGNSEKEQTSDEFSVLVYISGNLAGSPPYQKLNDGALEFIVF